MRTGLWIGMAALAAALSGCGQPTRLLVDFDETQPLRYRMTSQRTTLIELTGSGPKDQSHTTEETLELVIQYTTLESDPFGLSRVQGRIESARATRTALRAGQPARRDAAELLQGKTFTMQVSPTGVIEDKSELVELVRSIGDQAFVTGGTQPMKVKDPDMLTDFIWLQWTLWDAVSSIPRPLGGVEVGDTWSTQQLLTLPIPVQQTIETTYTLAEITGEEPAEGEASDRKAVITSESTYVKLKAEEQPEALWPAPYGTEQFHLKGSLFAVMRQFRIDEFQGGGEQVYDIADGILESKQVQWKTKMGASFMLPLGDSVPVIHVDQAYRVELLSEEQ